MSGAAPQLPPGAPFASLPNVSTRILVQDDFAQWIALRDHVLQALPDPDMYVRESDEQAFFDAHANSSGQTIGVFAGDALIAYSMVGFPDAGDADNLGAVTGMPRALWDQVAHISSCMVHPAWRGNGMQRTLLAVRLAMAQSQGRPYCMGMVSLRNHRSRHNLMRLGMHIGWTGLIDGLQRQVLGIHLQNGPHFDMADERLIASDNFDALCEAGAQSYVGIGELRDGDEQVRLRFVRALRHAAAPR